MTTTIRETFRDASKVVVTSERKPKWMHPLLLSFGKPTQRIVKVEIHTTSPPMAADYEELSD